MQQPIRIWRFARQRLMATMVLLSVIIHAAAITYILTRDQESPASASEYMMVDLTKIAPLPEKEIKPEPVLTPERVERTVPRAESATASEPIGELSEAIANSNSAPVQLAMLKVGMRSEASLKHTMAVLDFDESPVSLASRGMADEILAATYKPIKVNGLGTRGPAMQPVIGMGGGMGGDCK